MKADLDKDFLEGGFARRGYSASPTWQAVYSDVREFSDRFVAAAWPLGRLGYGWPLDPLHSWSRMWEYPFVVQQLSQCGLLGRQPQILDIGPAVTFFTAWMLRHGLRVTNLDFDPNNARHFARVFRRIKEAGLVTGPSPHYVVGDARSTGLATGGFDAVVCISVLEHIPRWQEAVKEIDRLLRPGGHVILTIDVRLDERSSGLSLQDVNELLALFAERFELLTRHELEVPEDRLSGDNLPFVLPPQPRERHRALHVLTKVWPPRALAGRLRRTARRVLLPGPPPSPEQLAVFGGAWRKR